MKLTAGRVEGFLARPDPAIATVLLYGSDAGLIAERSRGLARHVVEALDDPFRVSELAADELRSAPGRLVEEAQAFSLMGGRRVVRVRDAGDGIAAAVKQLLALPDQEGFVLLEAGELGGGSSLRRAVEAAPRAMALPCFLPDERQLAEQLKGLLVERGLAATPEAFAWLEANLGGDRALTRSEVEKLDLYLLDAPERRVTLADVAAAVGDSSALRLDDAVRAAVSGDRATLDGSLDRLLAEGEAPQRVVRAAAGFLLRVLRLRAEVANGGSVEAAIRSARPPIHFSIQPLMVAAVRRWGSDALVEGLALLQAAELRCRSGAGAPEALICRAALGHLAGLPARYARPPT